MCNTQPTLSALDGISTVTGAARQAEYSLGRYSCEVGEAGEHIQ